MQRLTVVYYSGESIVTVKRIGERFHWQDEGRTITELRGGQLVWTLRVVDLISIERENVSDAGDNT